MSIEWYPGHIAKARREIKDKLKEVDIVIEIIDARCPLSSIDFLNEDIKKKKRLLVVNKVDLVDKKELTDYVDRVIKDRFKDGDDFDIVYVDSRDNTISKIIDKKLDSLCKDILDKKANKGIKEYKLKAVIIGAPNVGKSTFINSYIKKKVNKVENTPGVTKKLQWTKMSDKVLLLDTPGITVKKFDSEDVGYNLALIGSINDDILIKDDLAINLLKKCYKRYTGLFIKRYKLEDVSTDSSELEVMDAIARSRGFVKKGGSIDYDRVANLLINDFRKGSIGRVMLES